MQKFSCVLLDGFLTMNLTNLGGVSDDPGSLIELLAIPQPWLRRCVEAHERPQK